MERLKYTEAQIGEMLYVHMVEVMKESKSKMETLEKEIDLNKDDKKLKQKWEKEFDRYLKIFSALTGQMSFKEH